MSAGEDDQRRRQREMNDFAAMARGFGGGDDCDDGDAAGAVYDGSSLRRVESTPASTNNNRTSSEQKQQQQDAFQESFLKAARGTSINDSGSFALLSSSASTQASTAEKRNLSAAAARLSKDDEPTTTTTSKSADSDTAASSKLPPGLQNLSQQMRGGGAATGPYSGRTNHPHHHPSTASASTAGNNNSGNTNAVVAEEPSEETIPMFAEEVVMPRPLFFGAVLPPRVLEQTKQIVRDAVQRHELPNPRLRDLPPSVRNLVGALRTYGYGLDQILKDEDYHSRDTTTESATSTTKRTSFEEDNEIRWRGDPCVRSFQPVWGHEVRAERVKEYKAKQKKGRHVKKPATVSRVSTAPPRMVVSDSDEEEVEERSDDDNEEKEDDILEDSIQDLDIHASNHRPLLDKGDENEASSPQLAANEQFSSWIRADEESLGGHASTESMSSLQSSEKPFSPTNNSNNTKPLTEKEAFSQWARGSNSDLAADQGPSGTMGKPVFNAGTFQLTTQFDRSTFQRIPDKPNESDSDDSLMGDDEQKTAVGANDNLSKALALLSEDGHAPASEIPVSDQTQLLLSQVATDGSRKRPMTNFELTGGITPLFGVDDSPLPTEADLGKHETKDEQQRAFDQKRSQEIVEKFVPPNVFGSIACPNPAINPDDFHSWHARTLPAHRISHVTSNATITSDPVGLRRSNYGTSCSEPRGPTTPSSKPPKHRKTPVKSQKVGVAKQRYGWWNESPEALNMQVSFAAGSAQGNVSSETGIQQGGAALSLQLPPEHHSSSVLQVTTPLEPSPEKLKEDNLPLSRMHPATSMVQSLPYLADRPPSYRYLQIDTTAVAFPPVKGEIEPLFCSLAIYNVETLSSGVGQKSVAPIPDVQRCGRVTEALRFDYVSDSDVEIRCAGALWPYSNTYLHPRDSVRNSEQDQRLRGTRCGVFPLPSNLNVNNLYAVLIVRKVMSEETDFDPYLRPGKALNDLDKCRASAEKASKRQGNLIVPFAFGVAPLLQVFGTETPVVASSRAVQIPLFHFSGGERQIIDHIMVMLFPRADHKANGVDGPAPVTNGGTAMLVMRNFGYLGLQTAVDCKSSLARDRLVDFTGELQLRRRMDSEPIDEPSRCREPFDTYRTVLPPWQPRYISEPTIKGGRNPPTVTGEVEEKDLARSELYAQELAPLPLLLDLSSGRTSSPTPGSPRGRLGREDIEPIYHTTFCNELLCQPRILHNCSPMKLTVKVEVREMEWIESFNSYFAHIPNSQVGPCVHNPRRGPFLVQSAFTSCTPRRTYHHFLDELKVKLPLDLTSISEEGKPRVLSLLFTVYRVRLGSASKWRQGARKLFGPSILDTLGSTGEFDRMSRLEQVACGFLPLTSQSCVIGNGLHDVRIAYKALTPSEDMCRQGVVPADSLVLAEMAFPTDGSGVPAREDSYAEDTTISDASLRSERPKEIDSSMRTDSNSDLQSLNDDSVSRMSGKTKVMKEPLSLSARIVVFSSLHSQNSILGELLSQETELPRLSYEPNKVFMATLRMGREYLTSHSQYSPGGKNCGTKVLDLAVAITDHHVCSVSNSTGHLLRILSILWRTLICGDGEPSLAWANPSASTPLRVHSFATILHLVGAASLYLSKHGVSQVDGSSKWNVVVLGRVISLLFDEEILFREQAVEKFDEKKWTSGSTSRPKGISTQPPRRSSQRRGHIRQTFELGHDILSRSEKTSSIANFPSQAGDLATLPKPRQRDTQTIAESLHSDSKLPRDELTANPEPPKKVKIKVDSKSDFQSFLSEAMGADEDFDNPRSRTETSKLLGGIHPGSSSRFNTAPASTLATILEQGDDSAFQESNEATVYQEGSILPSIDVLQDSDDDKIVDTPSHNPISFRRPRPRVPKQSEEVQVSKTLPRPQLYRVTTDDDIEEMGDAYLDELEKKNPLLGTMSPQSRDGEEKRVGSSHHRRRTHGQSSIDWSLKWDKEDRASPTASPLQDVESTSTPGCLAGENEDRLSTLKAEESSIIKLPNFVDRLEIIGNASSDSSRWFPFAYEVVIMQWAAVFIEQRKSGEHFSKDQSTSDTTGKSTSSSNDDLTRAAKRSVGVAVAGAPMLFEIIKKSLGFRVKSLFNKVLGVKDMMTSPPLVALDEALMVNLIQVISMVTDACLDARNFDSWDLRQMSIDVNDSIIRFLRDLFSFLAPSCVHRLLLTYLSRFLTSDGKHVSSRDSLIGLRCSWEITKLRMNAVTALVRFPDFVKVNGPQMLNWNNWWTVSPTRSSGKFFDDTLCRYESYGLPDFVGREGTTQKEFLVPAMRPHWMVEIVVDICLLGTEHADQYIHHRSASLLYELFWSCSQESIFRGTNAPIASMFVTFLEKVIPNTSYLSNFSPKSQLRKDTLTCCAFVLQSTPANLLRALWRRLCHRLPGKGGDPKYNMYGQSKSHEPDDNEDSSGITSETRDEPDILGMFSILNLALRTFEYEGCDERANDELDGYQVQVESWHNEFLLSRCPQTSEDRRRTSKSSPEETDSTLSSSPSRKWQAHDGAVVIINVGHQIVREVYGMLKASTSGQTFLNPEVQGSRQNIPGRPTPHDETNSLSLSKDDIVLFIRAATSLYLHALALRESDIVIERTFRFSAEVVKIFGIKLFLEAVGETLQHWMRVISLHCGARRAPVRIEASDLLELILRSTWECFGSFVRIRVPLLAVQTEVMERIVATAAARYHKEQRSLGSSFESFTNVGAEASLVPLWRTLDRIQTKPASQNVAFRGALVRIAGKLKKLYRAYVAARALSFIKGSRDKGFVEDISNGRDFGNEAQTRANRINILRVLNESEGFSKQFLGFQGTTHQRSGVAHYEAVEDALIEAADVFSPTELPEHRVAWLRMLAHFHNDREKFAEEATCHYYIHVTLHLAARLHASLWSNTPFLPWTDNIPDPIIYIDRDTAPSAEKDFSPGFNLDGNEWDHNESSASFRRIFYRVSNSVSIGNQDWESGGGRGLFHGIAFAEEYWTISPWITLREMEENMVKEVEMAGSLFLRAGIVESSRFSWSLATQYYAENFNYAKLASAYGKLATTVVSQVPSIDTSLPQEVSSTLGRFYRVWFHGGAPDELTGVEFVYRTQGSVGLKEFGEELRNVLKSIIQIKTPTHLILDGLSEERDDETSASYGGFRIGPAPLEPVRIKVTPLRPLFGKEPGTRGLPDWFHQYVEEAFSGPVHRTKYDFMKPGPKRLTAASLGTRGRGREGHQHSRSFSATMFSSAGSSGFAAGRKRSFVTVGDGTGRLSRVPSPTEGDLTGVDKFCFVQPKDRSRPSEWWNVSTDELAEKSLRVTQLQVGESFPACVARQKVAHRQVFLQSPLEAGIDSVCEWCAILFRTAIATSGMEVLRTNYDPGIGTDAAKVVADSIHNSHVKEIGLSLLKKPTGQSDAEQNTDYLASKDTRRLSLDEINKLQLKLARLMVAFVELLHLLIARNRDQLLEVINERKKNDAWAGNPPASAPRGYGRTPSGPIEGRDRSIGSATPSTDRFHHRRKSEGGYRSDDNRSRGYQHSQGYSGDNQSYHSIMTSSGVRTDSAIAVQSELQRAFISLTKNLYKNVHDVLHEDTPNWLKQCGQDNYFSLATYKKTKIPIAEELCYGTAEYVRSNSGGDQNPIIQSMSQHSEPGSPREGGSIGGGGSVISRGSNPYSLGGQF